MTRAKERLKQLESRNAALEQEVVKLRQHIAILDHVVASNGGKAVTQAKDSQVGVIEQDDSLVMDS